MIQYMYVLNKPSVATSTNYGTLFRPWPQGRPEIGNSGAAMATSLLFGLWLFAALWGQQAELRPVGVAGVREAAQVAQASLWPFAVTRSTPCIRVRA